MAMKKAPRWLSTDLRDGNQALPKPMSVDEKMIFFDLLVKTGFKEIEISYPSSGANDFDFTRQLVSSPAVPDDVWLQVISPCRKDLIRTTVDSVRGAKKIILHLLISTSPCAQKIVLNMSPAQQIATAVECTKYARSITVEDPALSATRWTYQFSAEMFSSSEPDFVVAVCNAVKDAWQPTEDNPMIFNLPATVEISTPNIFADQVEYFCRHMSDTEGIVVSVHPHNDRGCAVAAAELAQMAGAQRVEGTLFGNGERTGNVDLVTLALNLYTHGINPGLDFSDLDGAIRVVEACTRTSVPARTPYAGKLVYSAFSGSHQDAIKKGLEARATSITASEIVDDLIPWNVPYLPMDPHDVGRKRDDLIRINAQSGKAGAAWMISRVLQLDLPRELQVAFSKIVQAEAESRGDELYASDLHDLFVKTYHLNSDGGIKLVNYECFEDGLGGTSSQTLTTFKAFVDINSSHRTIQGSGSGVLRAIVAAFRDLSIALDVEMSCSQIVKSTTGNRTAIYTLCGIKGSSRRAWGVGVNQDNVRAIFAALLSAAYSLMAIASVTQASRSSASHVV